MPTSRGKTPENPSRSATKRVKDPVAAPTVCRFCQGCVEIASNAEVYGRAYGDWPWVFICRGCRAYVGLHPFTGIPLGTLANSSIRAARKVAKESLNSLWQGRLACMSRAEAYAWASQALGISPAMCHVGMFDEQACHALVLAIKNRVHA